MNESAIDKAVYAELQETTGAEFAAELMDTFIEEASGMLAELRRARAENHAERFRRAAHSLKSNSNTFGAESQPSWWTPSSKKRPACWPSFAARAPKTTPIAFGVQRIRSSPTATRSVQ